MNKKVGIERCESYDPEEVYAALKKAVDSAGDFDPVGKTVLLKPNILSDAAPDRAVTTHPAFLEGVIRLVKDMGARGVLVGDSPGLQTPGFAGKICGIGEVTRKNGAEWVDFTSAKTEVLCPEGKVLKKLTVTKTVLEADLIISVPKLKTHQLMYYTGAMKNMFGLVPSVAKSAFHVRFPGRNSFASMIVDLNLAVKPVYTFMDAIIGMEGPGPGSGNPRHIGLVLASSNLLAIDTAASTIIGYPPGEIPINRDALSRKYWLKNFDEIEYPCLSPKDVEIPDFVKIPLKKSPSQFLDFIAPSPLRKIRDSFAPGPQINREQCVRCGDCVRICSPHAMRFTEGKERQVLVDYDRCIRCFCCHEICPEKAISIAKRPWNRKLS